MLAEAIWAVDTDVIEQLREVRLDLTEQHSRLVTALQVTRAVHRYLHKVILDGYNAQQMLDLKGRRID